MNVYLNIWLNPIRTFQHLSDKRDSQPMYLIPFYLFGTIAGINSIENMKVIFDQDQFLVSLVAGIILGICGVVLIVGIIFPSILRWVGLIWKGRATSTQLGNVYSLALLPSCLTLIFQLMHMGLGLDPNSEFMNRGAMYIMNAWTFSLLIIGISKTQGFSYGFALLNLLISQLPWFVLALVVNR